MRITRRWIAGVAVSVLLSSVPMTGYGAVITYTTKSNETTSKSDTKTKETYGPGYLFENDDEEDFNGPSVKKVSLTERYHEEYAIYEESMADLFFLYATVGNGGITHKPVSIDIPANIMYTMEKDGLSYAYASRQEVSARGTYVLRLTAVENPELPLSEQTEYQATFRFRIQDEPPVSQKTETSAVSGSYSTSGSYSDYSSLWDTTDITVYPLEPTPENVGELANQVKDAAVDMAKDAATDAVNSAVDGVKDAAKDAVNSAVDDVKDAAKEQLTNAAGEVLDQVSGITDAISGNQGDAQTEPAIEEPSAAPEEVRTPRLQVYNPEDGKYVVTLENGLKLASTVPEGYVGPASVGLTVAEGVAERAELYRNDEPIEFINGNSQMDDGVYRLVLDDCSYSFQIAHSIGNMDYYPAPVGMHFKEAFLDNEPVALSSDQNLQMKEEGTYSIYMEGESGDYLEITLFKDITAPEVAVTVKGGTASIEYRSDDITKVILEKDGEVVEGFGGVAISTPGTYKLTAMDDAGNQSTVDFVLTYQINLYGIVAVFGVIALVVALVLFILHTKKNMKVR